MVTASIQGIFNLLILGFGLTGPYRNSFSENTVPFEVDAPVVRPPFADPVATAVTGSISVSSSGVFQISPQATVSLLRGFITLGVAANAPQTDIEAGKENTAETTLIVAEFMQRELSAYWAAKTDPLRQAAPHDTSSTRGFYGLADTLVFALAYFSRLEPPNDKALMKSVTTHIESCLVEHPDHSVFATNTSQDTLVGRTRPDFTKCRNGPLLEFLSSDSLWSFWRDWYQGFLDGKPLDWELQRRVALIPDEDWEKGPEHIARLIEDIRARFELEKRIEELETEKQVWQERARLGIGGNHPPEAIEDVRIVQEIIWAPIEELKAETHLEAPDKSKVKRILEGLIQAAKWLGEKILESAIAATVGACFANPAKAQQILRQIIDATANWLGTLF